VEPDLISRIKEAQKEDSEIWTVVENLDKQVEFRLNDDNVKIEHQQACGLLQPLDIPVWKWDEISMDFVTGLVEIFQQEIVRLHGTPSAIVSDRDPRFASRFWKGLQKAWGTRLKFSTAFHPQTDVEFAYNNSWHASIKCAPFEMLYGRKCRAPIYWDQVGERVIEGPKMIEVSLRIEPDLISRIKEAQKEDSKIWTIVENLNKQVEFRLDDDNVLWQDTRLVVPSDVSLREALLTEAHSSPFLVHSGSTKMYHDLKQYFWWSGMKRDVATFVARCLICQQVKIEHQRASGLLQQLDIPVWKWDEISMDFVTSLPQTKRRHDSIWVVVDRLTKSAHFLPIRKDYFVSRLAEIFQQEIVRLHGTPSAIVSDRDPRFASRFWKGLQKAWGTRLKFSTAFHPQTDGQSELTIQTLEDMLRSCALEWTGNWDDYICLVTF
nr:transposon Ty3-I Gag-Pol polyprotein [Tanacetum cinerariifolium]